MSNISTRLLQIVDELSEGKHTVFAKKCGITPTTFQNYIKGRDPNTESLIRICETFGVSITWILTGKGQKYLGVEEEEPKSILEQKRETAKKTKLIEHMELVGQFSDNALAMQINMNLIEIEKLSPAALKSLADKIDGVLMGLRISKGDKDGDSPQMVANGGKK